ncbi:MAG: CvpA family protein [Clostridium sp.]|nr:CvpA family protein [Prevotella sp.]MCM1429514.1 CvpA family protein [Clostridium sp.]MCM1476130.1 CvpA family protein [Muribaculaceae bacterium]
MSDAIYHLTVIVLAALGVVRGFRSGFPSQFASTLGICFGIVCAHVFYEPIFGVVSPFFPQLYGRLGGDFFVALLSASLIFLVVFGIVQALSAVLRSAMSIFSFGMMGSICAALLCMGKYLFLLSIFFNLIVDYNPYSSLLKFATDNDGNVVAGVMAIAPAALGVPGCRELAHVRRLHEASLISGMFENFTPPQDVSILINNPKILRLMPYEYAKS